MKTCAKCHKEKAKKEFHSVCKRADGLHPYCKECRRTEAAEMYRKNREKYLERNKKWKEKNPEKMADLSAKWYLKNRDKCSKLRALRDKENPERCRIKAHNRRARINQNGGKLSADISKKLYKLQRGKCACGCGKLLMDDYHLDHRMPISLGGVNEDWNMQLLTVTCNLQKHAKHPIDFMQSRGFLL